MTRSPAFLTKGPHLPAPLLPQQEERESAAPLSSLLGNARQTELVYQTSRSFTLATSNALIAARSTAVLYIEKTPGVLHAPEAVSAIVAEPCLPGHIRLSFLPSLRAKETAANQQEASPVHIHRSEREAGEDLLEAFAHALTGKHRREQVAVIDAHREIARAFE